MNILLVHQNFPAQFKNLGPALARNGHHVVALSMRGQEPVNWQGVSVIPYRAERGSTPGVHRWVADIETKVVRGEACMRAALKLKAQGFIPDVILAHPGWGESLFLKEVWPGARLGMYCEFFYRARGADTGFDPEFPVPDPEGEPCRLALKNLNNKLHFDVADAGLSPTYWQASTYPDPFRQRISVVHDGVETDTLRPDHRVRMALASHDGSCIALTRDDEVITFVNRNLEPYRGYHTFMRCLPLLLRSRPRARVLIVGGSEVSYGAKPPAGTTWREHFIDEVRPQMRPDEWARVHFLGRIPYENFVPMLQLSTVHVYLTYPFVLSWSLLEAMSIGCAVVASDTAPVREAIQHDVTGRLVDFFSPQGLAEEVIRLLDDPDARARLGAAARDFAISTYDLKSVCLPKQLQWVESLRAA